jgi:hypothetical protein
VAQTKKKRRRKHRGTQGGKVDTRPARGRPRNRAEARQRAQARRSGGGPRTRQAPGTTPPTWGSAFRKGLFAALIFFALMALAFQRPLVSAAGIAAFMVAFYVPMAYYSDRFFYNRNLRKQQAARSQEKS